ncbi:MAG: MauE/DoxX family redox-associated membrane protein [Acidimicrobiia bacterium]
MEPLAGPLLAAAVLLVLGGAPKMVRPEPTARALASLRLPAPPGAVRALGLAEVAIGAGALLTGGRAFALAMGASYLAFALFLLAALARPQRLRSCGCLGATETPPTGLHLLLNLAGASIALLVAASPIGPVARVVAVQPAWGIPFLLLTAACVWFAYLALSRLSELSTLWGGARR